MKKLNLQLFTMMLLALLFSDVAPAADNSGYDDEPVEVLCYFIPTCGDPAPPLLDPEQLEQPTPETNTSTEKR